ncbi:unnamed protein product, partial [Dibothriocephalus latus]
MDHEFNFTAVKASANTRSKASQEITEADCALGQNPLHCDCNLRWLQHFFRTRFLDNGVAQCSTPKSMEFKSIFHAHPSNFTCPRLPSSAEAGGGGLRLG